MARHSRPPPGDLDRLIETERQLSARLLEAGSEARRITEEAREAVAEAERLAGGELEAGAEALRESLRRERDGEIAALLEEARREAGWFEALPPERIAALAETVVCLLLASREAP